MARSVLPFLLGLAAGTLGGLMGVGGGIILVPLLVHVERMGQHEAQGVSLAFTIATALVAVLGYYGSDRLNLPLALALASGATPGVMLGARVASRTSAPRLRTAFGILLLVVAARLLAAPPEATSAAGLWPVWLNIALGILVGFLAGLLGVGGGTFLVPALVLGQHVDQHVAQGVSLLMIVPVGIAGFLTYRRQGRIGAIRKLPLLLIGGAVGGFAGALLAHRIQSPTLSRLFAGLLVAAAAQMIFRPPRDTLPRSAAAVSGGAP